MKSATAHPDPLAFGERVAQKSQHCVSSQQNPDPVQQSRSCRQRTQRSGRRSCCSKLLTRGRRRKTRSTSASCGCRKEPAALPSPSRASFGRRQKAPRCPRLLALFPVCPVANALSSSGRRRKTRSAAQAAVPAKCNRQRCPRLISLRRVPVRCASKAEAWLPRSVKPLPRSVCKPCQAQ